MIDIAIAVGAVLFGAAVTFCAGFVFGMDYGRRLLLEANSHEDRS